MKTITLTEKQLEILTLALEELSENGHINEGKDFNGNDIDPEDSDTDLPITTQEIIDLNKALFL